MSWLLTFTQKVSLAKKKMGSRVCAHKLINPNEIEVHLKKGTYIPPLENIQMMNERMLMPLFVPFPRLLRFPQVAS
jgi:hypothetical protein